MQDAQVNDNYLISHIEIIRMHTIFNLTKVRPLGLTLVRLTLYFFFFL